MTEEVSLIRDVERSVLDCHHESQALLCHSAELAVYNVLLTYGLIIRVLASEKLTDAVRNSMRHHVTSFIKGLEWSLRWICTECRESDAADLEWVALEKEATELISWGRQFSDLAIVHTAWSRGEMVAAVNKTTKQIRFDLRDDFDPTTMIFQWESDGFVSQDFGNSIPSGLIGNVYEKWRPNVQLEDVWRVPAVANFLTAEQSAELINWATTQLWPELPDSTDLRGFTLGQFRKFYASFFVECECMFRIEAHALTQRASEYVTPAILKATPAKLTEFLVQITGLEPEVIIEIIEMLTFDAKRRDHSLMTHPFVKTTHYVFSLARHVASIEPYRMLTCALLRSKRRPVYERIVNRLERINVRALAERLRDFGILAYPFPKFKFASDDLPLTPDLLLIDKTTGLCAVGDYKHAVPPVSSGEVANKLKERRAWNLQVKRYLESAQRHKKEIQNRFAEGKELGGLCGFVLHRWPLPIPSNPEPHIAYVDVVTLNKVLLGSPGISLDVILGFFFGEQHISDKPPLEYKIQHLETIVGDWKYLRPVVVGLPNTNLESAPKT